MAREDNLKKFSSEYQPEKNGRPKGSKNRSTIARKWLDAMQTAKNPITGEDEQLSQEDLATLAQIKKAREGNTHAYKALMDSAFGLPTQHVETTELKKNLPDWMFNVPEDED